MLTLLPARSRRLVSPGLTQYDTAARRRSTARVPSWLPKSTVTLFPSISIGAHTMPPLKHQYWPYQHQLSSRGCQWPPVTFSASGSLKYRVIRWPSIWPLTKRGGVVSGWPGAWFTLCLATAMSSSSLSTARSSTS